MKFRRTTAEECELHFTRVAPAGMDFFSSGTTLETIA
jgi:hypothetical protein